MRRQGTSAAFLEEFTQGMDRFRHLTKVQKGRISDKEAFVGAWLKQGHAHSDFDSERDGDPWDEYNKIDQFTSLETKLAKKLNQFPHIDLHSRTPYLNENQNHKSKNKEDPQKLLYKKVAKEHRK